MEEHLCLLAIYAHPDDEAFSVAGSLRMYGDAGVKTALLCATRGEQGQISNPALATRATLGEVRSQELREACRILAIEDVSFLDLPDGGVAAVETEKAIGEIVYHIRRLRPQVIVTFGANGDYGHPDHIAIHHLACAAFQRAGDPTCYPAHLAAGFQPYTPSKLYAHALAWSVMRQVYRQLQAAGSPVSPGGAAATIPVQQMGTPDEEVTTLIPLDAWSLAAKMAAMQAHRTQLDPHGPFYHFPTGAVRTWLQTERFRLLYPQNGERNEDDLFVGISEGNLLGVNRY